MKNRDPFEQYELAQRQPRPIAVARPKWPLWQPLVAKLKAIAKGGKNE